MVGLKVRWGTLYYNVTADGALVPTAVATPQATVPAAALCPALPPHETRRDAVQRAASRGWGPWLHDNMLAVVQLPAAATVTTKLCQVSTGRCIDGAAPDGQQHLPGVAPSVRVGHHAVDRSYVQFFVGPVPGVPANISIEYSVTDSPGAGDGSGSAVAGDRAQILLLATLQRGGEERLAMDGRVIRTPLSIFQS